MNSYIFGVSSWGGKGPFQMRGLWTGLILSTGLLAGCSGGQLENFSTTPAENPAASSMASYDVGKTHFAAGRYGLAIKSFKSDLQRSPDSVKTLNAVAASYDRIGRFDLADYYYERAQTADPQSVQTANNMGYSWLLRGDRGKAQEYFQLAQALDPSNAVVGANLAQLEGEPAAVQVASQVASQDAVPSVWIERKSEHVQYLVISPSREILEQIRGHDVEPQLIAYSPRTQMVASRPAESVPVAAKAPISTQDVAHTEQSEAQNQDLGAIRFVPGLAGLLRHPVQTAVLADDTEIAPRIVEQLAAVDPYQYPM